jgi:hypothetical protein
MTALDYGFFSNGYGLRLRGQCRSGWTKGSFGSYYHGVCTFDWKLGMRCRAELKLNAGPSLEDVEAMEISVRDDAAFVEWRLADGFLTVTLPIVITQPELRFHPSLRSTGYQKATITHDSFSHSDTQHVKLNLVIFLKWDVDRPEIVAWAKGTGMASWGLPSLGKRR